jgi:hypothetical protein
LQQRGTEHHVQCTRQRCVGCDRLDPLIVFDAGQPQCDFQLVDDRRTAQVECRNCATQVGGQECIMQCQRLGFEVAQSADAVQRFTRRQRHRLGKLSARRHCARIQHLRLGVEPEIGEVFHQPGQSLLAAPTWRTQHETAATGMARNQPIFLQRTQRFSHGLSRDAEFGTQCLLGGELLTRLQFALQPAQQHLTHLQIFRERTEQGFDGSVLRMRDGDCFVAMPVAMMMRSSPRLPSPRRAVPAQNDAPR